MLVDITEQNFGTLCICAIRYCFGRQTYMPNLVQTICKEYLPVLSDRDIKVMLDDCEYQRAFNLYGDIMIDKPDWLDWKKKLIEEAKRRKMEVSKYERNE